MMRYSCNLRGQCEEDWDGVYLTAVECQAACVVAIDREAEDVARQVISYDEERALALAPSDRVTLFRELTGLKVGPVESYRALLAYYTKDYLYFYSESLSDRAYLRETLKLSPLFLLILELHYEICQGVSYEVIYAIYATDWQRLATTAHLYLTRLVRGVYVPLLDDPPNGPVSLQYVVDILISKAVSQRERSDERWLELIRERALPFIERVYGVIPNY